MTRPALVLALLLASPVAVAAQAAPDPCATTITVDCAKKEIVALGVKTVRELQARSLTVDRPFSGTIDSGASLGSLITVVVLQGAKLEDAKKKEAYKTLVDLMAVRVDTQIGSSSQSSGSTSLAMKGAVPAILGFAVEHGALTRDVNGTVVTFRASPVGVVKALQGEGLLDIYRNYDEDAGFRFASRFSLAASFDTSRGDTPKTLLANEQQLTAWSVDVVLHDGRDPRAQRYLKFWENLATEKAPGLLDLRARVVEVFGRWEPFAAWHRTFVERVRHDVDDPWQQAGKTEAATREAADSMTRVLNDEIPKLVALGLPPEDLEPQLRAYVAGLAQVVKLRNDIYAYALKGSLATFDWTTARDPNLPDLYTLTGVYEGSVGTKRITDVTANAHVSLYSEKVGGHKLKDVGVTAQLDRPLGSVAEIPFAFTAAFRWQYIPKDVLVPASALITSVTEDVSATPQPQPAAPVMDGAAVAPKGHIVVGQAKLTIPLKGGVKIPLSVTLANRTELITEKKVIARANLGITFDLDAFTAAVKAR